MPTDRAPEPEDRDAGEARAGESPETVRGLLRHSWIYSLAPVLQRLLAIVLIRFYTQKLEPGEFGILDLADTLILLVPQLVGVNLLAALTRFYFEHRGEKQRAAVIGSATLALLGSSLVITALLLSWRTPLAGALFASPPGQPVADGLVEAFTVAVLIVPFSLCTRSAMQYLLVLKRSRTHTAILLSKTLFEAALKLWMLFGLEWGVFGFLLSVLIGEALFALVLVGWMALRIGLRFDWQIFRPMLYFALPLLPVGVLQLILHQGDRLLLGHLGPATVVSVGADGTPLTTAIEWVGVYGLGYKIGFLLHTAVLASFMQIWQPHVFSLGDRDRAAEMRRVGTFALVALALLYLPAAIFGRQAVDLLAGSEAYREAWRVVPWIVLAYLAYAAYSMAQVALLTLKRTWPLLWLNAAAVVINLSLNSLWIPRFEEHGYLAPTFVTLITFLVLALLGLRLAERSGLGTFQPGRALVVAALAVSAVAAAVAVDAWRDPLDPGALLPTLGLKATIGAALAFGLWRLALDTDGRAGLRRLFRDGAARLRG